jgi:hypothetical protein
MNLTHTVRKERGAKKGARSQNERMSEPVMRVIHGIKMMISELLSVFYSGSRLLSPHSFFSNNMPPGREKLK